MILDLDIGNTLSKWRLKDAESSEIRSRGAVWTREEWRPGADIPDLDVVEAVRISSVARTTSKKASHCGSYLCCVCLVPVDYGCCPQ